MIRRCSSKEKLGWQDKLVTVGRLFCWFFVTEGLLGNRTRKKTVKFPVPHGQVLCRKHANLYPNINAVGPAPPFACFRTRQIQPLFRHCMIAAKDRSHILQLK